MILFFLIFLIPFITSSFNGNWFLTLKMELTALHWINILDENNLPQKFGYNICCLFFILLSFNGFGFLLYVLPITTHMFFTLSIAFSIWLFFTLSSFYNFKINFFANFFPNGAPLFLSPLLVFIEFISNICRPIALGLRIAANLSAGHILLGVLGDFGNQLLFNSIILSNFTSFILIFMIILELGVCIIQAYVFSLLIIIYGKDTKILH